MRLNLRSLLYSLGVLLVSPLVAADMPPGPSAAEVMERLKRGNAEYASGHIDTSHLTVERRVEVSKAQKPFASVLTCADSRVPAEEIFGQGLGDLFVVRVAGAVAVPGVLGSLEYAAEHLGSNVIVVMGHTSCGAVKAALDERYAPARPEPAQMNLQGLLNFIRPALDRPQEHGDPWTSAVYASVEQTIDDIVMRSPVLNEMARSGKLMLVGAVYQLDTGKAIFSKPISLAAPKAAPTSHTEPPAHKEEVAAAHGEHAK
jgi:carbonic anhydrase